ncbi:hypothetical protein BS50DRAFT_214337 [Corynespora cassiicola Philippines]|uniref:Uncharacterized protein n=1 Tax=Corynespora cassiicola Philippines TaxID=1448308 RepID=A0A2T2N4I0_CORCC|nr:hypothetical protein BS50DRAFT_214337 [Corynespora cassiicola Philippines]
MYHVAVLGVSNVSLPKLVVSPPSAAHSPIRVCNLIGITSTFTCVVYFFCMLQQ